MLKSIRSLKSIFSQWLAVACHAWHDVRVPLSARLMVMAVPLYCLCPYDLNLDFSPGGYVDDLWIGAFLVSAALRLVPRAVFKDARMAVAIGAIGVVLSVGSNYSSAKHVAINLDSTAGKTGLSAPPVALPPNSSLTTATVGGMYAPVQAPGLFRKTGEFRNSTSPQFRTASQQSGSLYIQGCQEPLITIAPSSKTTKREVPTQAAENAGFPVVSFLLTGRGGNFQLYRRSNGTSPLLNFPAHNQVANNDIDCRHQDFGGGNCFADLDRFLIPSEAPC